MEYRLQNGLQVASGDLLSDAVSNRRHGCFELHFGPVRLWDRPR